MDYQSLLWFTSLSGLIILILAMSLFQARTSEERLQAENYALKEEARNSAHQLAVAQNEATNWHRELEKHQALAKDQIDAQTRRLDDWHEQSHQKLLETQTALDIARQMCGELPSAQSRVMELERTLAVERDRADRILAAFERGSGEYARGHGNSHPNHDGNGNESGNANRHGHSHGNSNHHDDDGALPNLPEVPMVSAEGIRLASAVPSLSAAAASTSSTGDSGPGSGTMSFSSGPVQYATSANGNSNRNGNGSTIAANRSTIVATRAAIPGNETAVSILSRKIQTLQSALLITNRKLRKLKSGKKPQRQFS